MHSRCKLIGLLTPLQLELLKSLAELHAQLGTSRRWRPRDLGASRSSSHAKTLGVMAQQGWVSREVESEGASRLSYTYQISEAGLQLFQEFRTLASGPVAAVPGTAVDRRRATWAHLAAAAA